jgi:vacuolar-type H+-ATPase subunit C/Vma6
VRSLRREIIDLGGTAQVMRCQALAGASDLIEMYNAARDEEYTEIVNKCRDFLQEIENEAAAEHFSYADLEETTRTSTNLKAGSTRSPHVTPSAPHDATTHKLPSMTVT